MVLLCPEVLQTALKPKASAMPCRKQSHSMDNLIFNNPGGECLQPKNFVMKKTGKKSLIEFKSVEILKPQTSKVKGGDGPASEDSLDL